jgi:hypothetical protein
MVFIGFSELESESSGQLMPAARKMPPDGDGVDAKKRRDRSHRESLELIHHDDSAATRGQVIERPPHGRSNQERPFRVVVGDCCGLQVGLVALVNFLPAPLISSNVDEYADQPCFLLLRSARHGLGRASNLEEGFLNQIEGVIGLRDETSRETVQSVNVRVEQS